MTNQRYYPDQPRTPGCQYGEWCHVWDCPDHPFTPFTDSVLFSLSPQEHIQVLQFCVEHMGGFKPFRELLDDSMQRAWDAVDNGDASHELVAKRAAVINQYYGEHI